MGLDTQSTAFPELAGTALSDAKLGASLDGVRRFMPGVRKAAVDAVPGWDALTEKASEIRDNSIKNMDSYLEIFETKVRAAGGEVHRAADAAEAREIIAGLVAAAGGGPVIKAKSMVTEEIELNAALEARGFEVTETDLGEYIIQLRGERPSHILAPSLHLDLDDVREAFRARHGSTVGEGAADNDALAGALLAEARQVLRGKFTGARVGITGANFLVAETGHACIVTNEGNADLCASLPDTHIVVTGIEKVVPTLADLGVLLRVLARSAVGEPLSCYTTLVNGPRRAGDTAGPRAFHLVLVDNGRRQLAGGEFEPMLRCIRCSACLNHCPVYTAVGGHAYGSVYSGPMGAVLTPALAGLPAAAHLPNASTFCGRCAEVCPVGIPLPRLLRAWRQREFETRSAPALPRRVLGAWRALQRWPVVYEFVTGALAGALRLLSVPGRKGERVIRRLPWPGGAWTRHRDLPAPEGRTFQAQWRERGGRT